MIVTNSSPIIFLGKQGELDLLKKCFKKAIIPRAIYVEVTRYKDNIESTALKKAINEKWVRIKKTNINPFLKTTRLDQGEKEAISLAAQNNYKLIIDDDAAKSYAAILKVEAHGTFYVIYLACLRKIINKTKATKILRRMIADGFYVSAEQYSKFIDLLNSLK